MEKQLLAKTLVESKLSELTRNCDELKKNGTTPTMAVVLVGKNPASLVYVRNKKNLCEKIGANFILHELEESINEAFLLKKIEDINKDPKINGCFVQLPLPTHLKHIDVTELISPQKDVDGFHFESVKDIYFDQENANSFIPCTPKGILSLLSFYNIQVEGANIVIVGRSLIVGKPLQLLFTNRNATVTLCHSKTKNLEWHTKNADIVIAAIGKAKFLNETHFRNDQSQIVIDVGINNDENGKLCGDVDFIKVCENVKAISPVPGGVGPLTVLSLIQNLLVATKAQQEKRHV